MIAKACLLLVVLLAAGTGVVHAQDTVRVADLVVTANKMPVSPEALTSTVTVLRGDRLRAEGLRTVADALREVPGLAVVSTGSYGGVTSLFLRGGESDYVKVLVDGVPQNEPGGAFNFADLTIDNIDRIEVVRGPVSVLYGSDAVTGVVQIFTRRGSGAPQVDGAVRGGTFGTVETSLQASGGEAALGYSIAASRSSTNGIYPVNNRYRNFTLSALARAQLDDRTEASLAVRHGDHRSHFPTNGNGVVSDSNQFSFGNDLSLVADVGRRLGSGLDLQVALTALDREGGADNRPDNPSDTTGFGFEQHSEAALLRRGADVRLNAIAGGQTMVSFGGAVQYDRERRSGYAVSDFGFGRDTSLTLPVENTRRTLAGYGQVMTDVAGRATLTGGLRLDDSDQYGGFFTFRLGAVLRAGAGRRLRGSVGNAFKEPTFSETFANSPFEVGNPALEPERSVSWEVGLEQELGGGRVTLGAVYFDQRFRDLIQYVPAAPGEPTYTNVGRATARGLELSGQARLIPGLVAGVGYTWLRTRVDEEGPSGGPGTTFERGQSLIRRPDQSGTLWLSAAPGGRWSGTVRATFVGPRDDLDFGSFPSPRVRLPGYAVVDLATRLTLLRPTADGSALALTARVENLFDQRYDTIVGFPGRGRALLGGVTFRF